MTTIAISRDRPRRRKPLSEWRKNLRHDWPIHILLCTGLFISLLPVLFMLFISVKTQGQYITEPLGLTPPFQWDNFAVAFRVLARPMLNSAIIVAANVIGSLFIASMAAYVFARFRFPGRELLFWVIIAILFIPGILTFAPRFVVLTELGMINTLWALILPAVASSQIFEIFILRAFFRSIANEVIDAARVDGAGVMTIYLRIVLPMSRPILATLAVLRTIDVWNEWLWPLLTIKSAELRPMAMQVFYLSSDMGAHVPRQMAGYVLATIPLIILFAFFSKQFIEGLTSGSLKW